MRLLALVELIASVARVIVGFNGRTTGLKVLVGRALKLPLPYPHLVW